MPTSSIDELLMGGSGNSLQPETPEHKPDPYSDAPEPENEVDEVDTDDELSQPLADEPQEHDETDADEDDESTPDRKEYDEDEYGNQKERMSKGMKERLDRKEKQYQREVEQRDREINALRAQLAQQGASPDVQKAARDFEFDPDAEGDWQQQLAHVIRHEVKNMARTEKEEQERAIETQMHREFETKFKQGIEKFDDFTDVIEGLPCKISDPMVLGTRAMENPAAFLYAAAKRHPQELERISKIRDPYAQMTEMGRLEERMRKNKPTTKAPRPLGRTPEDSHTPAPKKKVEDNGDTLLARADAKRLATVKTRLRGNR